MSTGTLIAIIVPVVVVLLLCALAASMIMRRRRLQARFGPEYQRTVEAKGSRRAAERELREREQRHDALHIKELPASTRDRYAHEWDQVPQYAARGDDGGTAGRDGALPRAVHGTTAQRPEATGERCVSRCDTGRRGTAPTETEAERWSAGIHPSPERTDRPPKIWQARDSA